MNRTPWLVLGVVAAAGTATLLVIILTDGRYFGKRLTIWIYDRLGPVLFSASSEAERWGALAERLGLTGDERILDVGTATGDLPLSLAARPGFRGSVVGLDWSPRMMAAARARARELGVSERSRFQVVDLREGLPLADQAFDLVFCLGLLETLPRPERHLEELVRVLAPGGRLVLSLYRGRSTRWVALSAGWYQEHLARLGLEDLETAPCRSHHELLIGRRPGRDEVL